MAILLLIIPTPKAKWSSSPFHRMGDYLHTCLARLSFGAGGRLTNCLIDPFVPSATFRVRSARGRGEAVFGKFGSEGGKRASLSNITLSGQLTLYWPWNF